MDRAEALKHFEENIVKKALEECRNEFIEILNSNEEKFGRLLIKSIQNLNKKALENKNIDENYRLGVLQFEFLRSSILNESYSILLHGYNNLWYLDTNSIYEEIDLKFLSEPFINLKEKLIKEKQIYVGKINEYDVQKIIFDITAESYNSISELVRSFLWDLDEEQWINDMLFSDFYIIKWSEYKGKGETVFAMDNRKKTMDDLSKAKKIEKKKIPFVYSVWKESKFSDFDLSKENMLFVNFKGSILENINFSESDIVSGELKNTKIKKCNFENGRIVGTTFERSSVKMCNFKGCDLRSSDFNNALLEEVDFDNSNFEIGNFTETNLYKISFKKCNLKNADFTGAQFEKVDFEGADLKNVIFSREDIPFLHLSPEQIQDILIEDGEQ